jgi:hypothetical protein
MTPEQQAAYIIAQAACAMARIAAMAAENQMRAHFGQTPAYGEAAFEAIPNELGIHHNDVINMFTGR